MTRRQPGGPEGSQRVRGTRRLGHWVSAPRHT